VWSGPESRKATELRVQLFGRVTKETTGIPTLLKRISELGIGFKDLNTRQSSLE